MADFDIQRFVSLSRAVDLSDIDWEEAARVGVTDDEHQVLRYMADTEAHTILYMRDLLAGHTARDPEVTTFLAVWVYEETHHGLALDRFLTAVGRPPPPGNFTEVTAGAHFMEEVEAFFTQSLPKLTRHFSATQMAWGAVNEATAAAAYTALARTTANRQLAKPSPSRARRAAPLLVLLPPGAEADRHSAGAPARTHRAAPVLGAGRIGVGGSREVIETIFAKYFADAAARPRWRTSRRRSASCRARVLREAHGFGGRCVTNARREPEHLRA